MGCYNRVRNWKVSVCVLVCEERERAVHGGLEDRDNQIASSRTPWSSCLFPTVGAIGKYVHNNYNESVTYESLIGYLKSYC